MRCKACNRSLYDSDWEIDPTGELCKTCIGISRDSFRELIKEKESISGIINNRKSKRDKSNEKK